MNKKTIIKFSVIVLVLSMFGVLLCFTYCFRNDQRIWNILTSISTAIVAISVLFLYNQIDLSKRISNSDFILRLDEVFNSTEIRKMRSRICKLDFANPEEVGDCKEILDFFEQIAYLEKKKVLTLEDIDEMWGYWIKNYWLICKDSVVVFRTQEKDISYYMGTEELFERLVVYGNKKKHTAEEKAKNKKINLEVEAYIKSVNKKDLDDFKQDESELIAD